MLLKIDSERRMIACKDRKGVDKKLRGEKSLKLLIKALEQNRYLYIKEVGLFVDTWSEKIVDNIGIIN